jgi:hypothetical protein
MYTLFKFGIRKLIIGTQYPKIKNEHNVMFEIIHAICGHTTIWLYSVIKFKKQIRHNE